jgi:lipopolysaccharide export system permease protein
MLNSTAISLSFAGRKYRMIFHRSLLREFANLAVAVFLTLFLIALTTRLIRLLGQAAGGKLPSDAVIAFLGFFALHILPVLLSLTLFITVLLTLARMWRDSEMVIWFNSGLALTAWMKPVLLFAGPLVFLIALLTCVLSPWIVQMSEQYRSRIDARDDLTRLEPGAFGESRSKQRVFFAESIAGDKSVVQNVFVNSSQLGHTGVMTSEKGVTEVAPNGDRFLSLISGRRYEGAPGEPDFRVMEFARYMVRVEAKEGDEPVATHKSLSTFALIESPTQPNLGELLFRIGVPLSALILALLAIPLSYVNPRAGRSYNLIFALLIYITYSNLLSVSQAQVAQGKLAFAAGWWPIHALMAAVALVMFARHLVPPGGRRRK